MEECQLMSGILVKCLAYKSPQDEDQGLILTSISQDQRQTIKSPCALKEWDNIKSSGSRPNKKCMYGKVNTE